MAKAGRGSDQFMVRLPEGMRERIRLEADNNGRSMNAEIVARLEDHPNLQNALASVMQERARLADEKEKLEWQLDRLEAAEQRFFDKDGKEKPVLTIPQSLYDRIRLASEQNHRTVDAEAQAALEVAFPPKAIDVNLLSAFLESLVGVSAPDGDEKYLNYINDALSKAKHPWTVRAGWDGEIRFYPYASPSEDEPESNDDGLD